MQVSFSRIWHVVVDEDDDVHSVSTRLLTKSVATIAPFVFEALVV